MTSGAAERVAGQLREAIVAGHWGPGTDLPPERAFADQLGVSRLTLRSALTRLETEGLVEARHGSGTRVLDYRETGGVDLLGSLARQSLERGEVPVDLARDVLELRRALAVEALGLVAARSTPEERSALRRLVEEQRKVIDQPRRFIECDLRFARTIIRTSGNFALELVFNTIVRALRRQVGFEMLFMVNASDTPRIYERMMDLVESGDPRRVRRVARRLLEILDGRTLRSLEALRTFRDRGGLDAAL